MIQKGPYSSWNEEKCKQQNKSNIMPEKHNAIPYSKLFQQ